MSEVNDLHRAAVVAVCRDLLATAAPEEVPWLERDAELFFENPDDPPEPFGKPFSDDEGAFIEFSEVSFSLSSFLMPILLFVLKELGKEVLKIIAQRGVGALADGDRKKIKTAVAEKAEDLKQEIAASPEAKEKLASADLGLSGQQ